MPGPPLLTPIAYRLVRLIEKAGFRLVEARISCADPGVLALLTTYGRRTGKPHTVALPYVEVAGRLFVVSAYGWLTDWLKNAVARRGVRVRLGCRVLRGTARLVRDTRVREAVRELFRLKYRGRGLVLAALLSELYRAKPVVEIRPSISRASPPPSWQDARSSPTRPA